MKLVTIKRLYDELNATNFRGRLARPTIRLTRNADIHGKVSDAGRGRCTFWIHPFSDNTERAMRATIYHEMVHQYLDYHLGVEDNAHHGDLFWLVYFLFANRTFDWENPEDYKEELCTT